ncbi:MAG: adenylate cyclase [Bacteroidetes bacterium]|nr:MAG: adenylate cyclase [Bacteroidota bacterium]
MTQEIERKFLVKSNAYKDESISNIKITQGFLSTVPERSIRVRLKGEKGFITIKGISNESGMSRFEWEKEIDVKDVLDLLKICELGVIEKTRFHVKFEGHMFEVDEFYGENEGLIIAEIELNSEEEEFKRPNWLGKEVTGQVKYYNSTLVKKPYKDW